MRKQIWNCVHQRDVKASIFDDMQIQGPATYVEMWTHICLRFFFNTSFARRMQVWSLIPKTNKMFGLRNVVTYHLLTSHMYFFFDVTNWIFWSIIALFWQGTSIYYQLKRVAVDASLPNSWHTIHKLMMDGLSHLKWSDSSNQKSFYLYNVNMEILIGRLTDYQCMHRRRVCVTTLMYKWLQKHI